MRTLSSLLRATVATCLGWLLTIPAHAQIPDWQMALAIGTPTGSSSTVNAIAVDARDNVYLAGSFYGTATFGATTLTSPTGDALYVAKWNPATGFVWAQQASGTSHDATTTALAVNGDSVYVAGTFRSPTLTLGATTLTNASGTGTTQDVFVAKLTDAGSTSAWTWAQQAGGASDDYATALVVRDGSVYAAGTFASTTIAFGATTLTNAGGNTGFVTKLTDEGSTSTWTWAQQASAASNRPIYYLAVSGTSIYVAGDFFGPTITFGTTTLTNRGGGDVFVARLTDGGSTSAWSWAQQAGGPDYDYPRALTARGSNVYVAGEFSSPTIACGATTLTSTGGGDVFVARLTDGGSTSAWAWAQQAGGPGDDGATALAVSGDSVYVAGLFYSATASFGATTLTNAGSFDGFVAKLTETGSTSAWTWALPVGGAASDAPTALAVDRSRLYVAGGFLSPSLTFGTITLTAASYSGFLAALADPVLGTADERGAPAFTLAPNPTRATAHLSGAAPGTRLTLADALGRTVLKATAVADGTATFDVRALPAGLYLVRAEGLAGARRLVVE